MRTIAELIRWRARRHPTLPATWYEGRTRSYGELDLGSSELAAALVRELALQAEDRVAILDKNSDAYLELLFALDKAGLVAAPLNWRLTAREIKLIVDDFKPKLIVTGAEFKATAESTGVKTLSFDELPRGGEDPGRDAVGAVTWQFSTSGTTGLPKGAMLTSENVFNTGLCLALEMEELVEGSRSLVAMPMFHLGGSGWAIWSFQQGATCFVMREAAAQPMLKVIVEQRIETALLVPAVLLFITELPEARRADFSAFKHVTYGTAPIAPDLLRRSIEIFGCRFTQIYGLTETAGPFTALTFEHHHDELLLSAGRPMFGARARVVDPEGRDMPSGEIGEVLYQGESLMSGYWARPQESEAAIRGGWFHTGDAGYIDENGFLFIKDRIKDLIVSGSENVYPAEIEAVLAGHPDLVEVAVIGVPDPRWGEAVKAVVVLRTPGSIDETGLIDWTRDKLAGYKRPRSIDFIDALPRNSSGKILRRTLREPYWAGYDRKVN